jgi:hypothetical protein
MKNQGWIKLHRKLLENPIFSSEKGLKIWIWCLLKATHSQQDFYLGQQPISLINGQFVFGREIASQELKMSASTVRNWIRILKKDSYITIKSTNKYSIITICKWNIYQDINQQKGQQNKNKWKTNGKQKDTYNKVYKMYENVKYKGKPFLKPENFEEDKKTGTYKIKKNIKDGDI